MPPLGKHTHTKTAFSNMVGSYFPWKMQVLIRFKVHLADIAEYTFNFLTSKSRFSGGCISVIVSVCFPNIVLRFFRMPSKFSHGCTIPCWNIGNICYQRGWGKKDTSRKSYPRHLYGKFPAGLVLKQVETVCFMCFAFFIFKFHFEICFFLTFIMNSCSFLFFLQFVGVCDPQLKRFGNIFWLRRL